MYRSPRDGRTPTAGFDVLGAVLGALALALVTYALIEAPDRAVRWSSVAGARRAWPAGVAFVYVERRRPDPMMPPAIFASRQFTAVNLVTLCVYAAFGGFFFLAALQLQVVVGLLGARRRYGAAADDRADAAVLRPLRRPRPSASGRASRSPSARCCARPGCC